MLMFEVAYTCSKYNPNIELWQEPILMQELHDYACLSEIAQDSCMS